MPIIDETGYDPSLLIANRHLGTLIPNLLRFPLGGGVKYDRQRIWTHDGDFLDLDWSRVGGKKLVLLSHGLEANAKAPYILGMVKHFNKLGYDTLAWNFRCCSGELNLTIPYYHPGQTDDFQLVLDHGKAGGYEEIYLIGFSLGGAYTLRYLGEQAAALDPLVKRAVVFSVPIDLAACAKHLSTGTQSMYGKAFLLQYKKKMLQKEKRNPGTYDIKAWDSIATLCDFDEAFNAPWYDFANAAAFYEAISSRPLIPDIAIPTLIINAMNDPFLPIACFPFEEAGRLDHIYLEVPEMGGHVGFMTLSRSGIYWSETRAQAFIEAREG